MNVFEGANVDMWGAVGGNRLLIFIIASIIWCIVCIPISKILGKLAGSIASVGVLVILYYWAKLFLD